LDKAASFCVVAFPRRSTSSLAVTGRLIVRMTLEDVFSRLGRSVPAEYESFVRLKGIGTLHASLAAPAEVCARNLEERALDASGPTSYGFVLCGRGDGNFFVLCDEMDGKLARVWSHEARTLTDTAVRATELLEELAETPIPEVTTKPGNYVLSRVNPSSQAILEPINPEELLNVTRVLAGLEYFDQLQGKNPFTNEAIHLNVTGLALSGREARLDLKAGALLTRNCGSEDFEQVARLADYLGCIVFPKLPLR